MGVETLSSTVSGSGSDDEVAGYIFLCSGRTKPECYTYRVFGLPSFRIDVVAKIKQNAKLFLFDFDVKLLYGVYAASSDGAMNLEPHAFGGKFPAQVKFEIFKECMPLPEGNFKHVITYLGRSIFRQDLSANQVDELISLFRPLSSTLPSPCISLMSNELRSRRIVQQEIEKQIQVRGIYSPVFRQASESQHIGSRFSQSSYQAPDVSLPFYDSERPLTSVHRVHDEPSVLYQNLPVSRLLLQNKPYFPEHPQLSYIPEYLASTPRRISVGPLTSSVHGVNEQLSTPYQHMPVSRLLPQNCSYIPEYPQQPYVPEFPASTQMLSSRKEVNGPFHNGKDVIPPTELSNDFYLNQNQVIGLRHGQAQIGTHISAPPQESDRKPSSVLAAAYWAAVASEIPQPPGPQTSESVNNVSGQASTPTQYKPPNLTSAALLEAYWEAKALEDSRQIQPHHPPVHGNSQQVFSESVQGPAQYLPAPYRVATATGGQSGLHYSYHQLMPNTQGDVFPISQTTTEVENQASAFASGSHQQDYYRVQSHIQMQPDIAHPYASYPQYS